MILADTDVVSELMRDEPDSSVAAWAQDLRPAEVTICVVTVEEIERGLGRLADGRRRRDLARRWERLVDAYAEMVAVYDVAAARATAQLLVQAEGTGRQMALADAQIAGICLADGYQLATRNTKDFADVADLALINPFLPS